MVLNPVGPPCTYLFFRAEYTHTCLARRLSKCRYNHEASELCTLIYNIYRSPSFSLIIYSSPINVLLDRRGPNVEERTTRLVNISDVSPIFLLSRSDRLSHLRPSHSGLVRPRRSEEPHKTRMARSKVR